MEEWSSSVHLPSVEPPCSGAVYLCMLRSVDDREMGRISCPLSWPLLGPLDAGQEMCPLSEPAGFLHSIQIQCGSSLASFNPAHMSEIFPGGFGGATVLFKQGLLLGCSVTWLCIQTSL